MEILIAMGIFMVIIGAIYASWAAILRSSRAGAKAAAEVQRNRITVKCLEDALASTVYFTENAAFYSFETDTSSDFAYLSFVTRPPASFPGSGLFPNDPIRRVAFQVVQGAGGNNELKLLQSSTMQILQDTEEPYTVTLSTNISQFALEFWDDQAQEWAYEWLETNSVPRMIRVSLAFGGQNGVYGSSVPIEAKTIYLAGTAITKDYQFPDAAGGSNNRNNNNRERNNNNRDRNNPQQPNNPGPPTGPPTGPVIRPPRQ